MRKFIINSGLIYAFPIVMSLGGVILSISAVLAINAIFMDNEHLVAKLLSFAIGSFGATYCIRATMNMFEEIPEIRRLQKVLDDMEKRI
jgi:hypothetical protein